jgi:hypothetical protein
MSWVTSLRLPPVRVTARGMPVASVIRWRLLPVLPRSTGLRPVLGPLLARGCGSRRRPPGRSPGRSLCGAWRGASRGVGATHWPRSTPPGGASTSCPSRIRAPAAGVPRRSRYAARTRCPGTPAGPDAASAPDAEPGAPPSAETARSPPTVRHQLPTVSAEPPHTPGSTVPERSNHLEDHFVRSSNSRTIGRSRPCQQRQRHHPCRPSSRPRRRTRRRRSRRPRQPRQTRGRRPRQRPWRLRPGRRRKGSAPHAREAPGQTHHQPHVSSELRSRSWAWNERDTAYGRSLNPTVR